MKFSIIMCLLILLICKVNAQTVVKMKITEEQEEEFSVQSILEDNLPINVKVSFGAIGYQIYGGQEPYNYTWLENNLVISEGETVNFTPRLDNMYSVVISDDNNCRVELPINTEDVSIEEIRSKVNIYPTIITNKVKVNCNIGQAEIEIFDVKGAKYISEMVYGNTDLDIDLGAGIYFAKISTSIGSYVERIIVK